MQSFFEKYTALEREIDKYHGSTICKETLKVFAGTDDDAAACEQILPLLKNGRLIPVEDTADHCTLCKTYRIGELKMDKSEVFDEIDSLNIKLLTNGILIKSPETYLNYRFELQSISRFLSAKKPDERPVSRRERSFGIFGDETQLDDRIFCKLLANIEIDSSDLCFYDTPKECLYDHICCKKSEMTLLISESMDIFYDLRDIMLEKGSIRLWGSEINGVIYGGSDISDKASALKSYVNILGTEKLHFVYWGDIDKDGLCMYQRLLRVKHSLDIKLFVPAYSQMLCSAENAMLLRDESDSNADIAAVYDCFGDEDRQRLNKMISDGKRVPQEIITHTDLSDLIG
ncbi:MAG: hypothetical protein II936_04155 [Oscillospiraceae bacterium]|nr:hypothetical protein [Oscillospiraceae bacterium]